MNEEGITVSARPILFLTCFIYILCGKLKCFDHRSKLLLKVKYDVAFQRVISASALYASMRLDVVCLV